MAGTNRLGELSTGLARYLRREFSDFANAILFYRWFVLSGRTPKNLTEFPTSLYKGDKAKGASVLAGRFVLAGGVVQLQPGQSIWDLSVPSKRFAQSLHRFDWLPDLIALDDGEGCEAAKDLVDQWIDRFGGWNWFSWDPKLLHSRINLMLMAGDVLFSGDNAPKRLKSVMRQVRRLSKIIPVMTPDHTKLDACITLSLASVVLNMPGSAALKIGYDLSQCLNTQIHPDGGHISRSPAIAAAIFIRLCELDIAAQNAGLAIPDDVRRAIDRLSGFVRFIRLPSGVMSSFHGGGEGNPRALEAALSHLGIDKKNIGPPFNVAPHTAYHRAQANGAIVLFDAGDPPYGVHGANAHASALAFEFTTPGGRLVVNCGWSHDQASNWREAVRATAAHSAVTLEETSAYRMIKPGLRRGLVGPGLEFDPGSVKVRRNEEDVGVWLEATHDGYRASFGMSLRRRLFLAMDGVDLRGEDSLFRPVDDGPPDDPERLVSYSIRFHLHPDVRASLSRDSLSSLLVLPNGDGWRFRTDGGPVKLEQSVYLSAGGSPQRSTQIVINGEAEPFGGGERPPNRVRWAFQRLGRVGTAG